MTGFESAFAGRSLGGLPEPLADALASYGGQSVTLGLRQGKPAAVAEALNLLGNEQGDKSKQIQYVQVLGEVRMAGAIPVLLRLGCHSPDNADYGPRPWLPWRRPERFRRFPQGRSQDVRKPLRRRFGCRPKLAGNEAEAGRFSFSRQSMTHH